MTIKHPLFLLLMLIAVLCNHVAQDRGHRMREFLPLYIVSGVALMVFTPLTSHRGVTVLGYLFDRPITLEAVLYGITSGLSVAVLLLIFTSFQLAVDTDGILFLTARILPNTTMVILLALRFVPHFKIRLREIYEVQSTRPGHGNEGSRRAGIRQAMQVCNILLARSLEDAVATAQSMRMRGYHLSQKRTFYFRYRMNRKNIICLIVLLLFEICLIICCMQGAFSAVLYPSIHLGPWSMIRLFAAALLFFFSIIPILYGGTRHGTN